jgi:hypothetical protein
MADINLALRGYAEIECNVEDIVPTLFPTNQSSTKHPWHASSKRLMHKQEIIQELNQDHHFQIGIYPRQKPWLISVKKIHVTHHVHVHM